jgi:WD40 repeat protein
VKRIGSYTILEELGRGGMGAVYTARHSEIGVIRAIKVMAHPRDARARTRFEREARNLASISHPNVVKIHDAGVEPSGAYFVMDLIEGQPLMTRMTGEPLPWRDVAKIMLGVCRGVGALHSAGLVHRDLKPDNVMLTPDGRAIVIDLGLALAPDRDDRLTRTGGFVGTVCYMPPESFQSGTTPDPRTDVYALGALLFEALTGEPVIHGDSIQELTAAIHSAHRPSAGASQPDLPARLDAACSRAMAFAKEDRFADGDALGDALEAILERPGPNWREARAPLRRMVALALCLGIGVAVAVAARMPAAAELSAPTPLPVAAPAPVTPRLSPEDRRAAESSLRKLKNETNPRTQLKRCDAWLKRFAASALAERVTRLRLAARMSFPLAGFEHPGVRGAAYVGEQLATFGSDHTARLWAADGSELHRWTLEGISPTAIAAAPDGRVLIGGAKGRLRLFDLVGRGDPLTLRRVKGYVSDVAFDREGRRVAITGGRMCTVRDYPTMNDLLVIGPDTGHVQTVDFLRNGELITGIGTRTSRDQARNHAVRFWDTKTGEQLGELRSVAKVTAVACSSDGTRIVVGNGFAQLAVIDAHERLRLGGLSGVLPPGTPRNLVQDVVAHTDSIRAVAFSPNGRHIYSLSEGRSRNASELRIWSSASMLELTPSREFPRPPLVHGPMWRGFAVSPRGDRIALFSAEQGLIQVWLLPAVE